MDKLDFNLREEAKQQLREIVEEHKLLKLKDMNPYGLGYEKNKDFYEKILKILLTGGQWQDTTYHSDVDYDQKIKKLQEKYQPVNCAKSDLIVPWIDFYKHKSKAH